MTNRLLPLLMAAIACAAMPASAQTLYRCGNTFQDHPCGGAQAGQAIGASSGTDAARTSATSPRLSTECSGRGVAAQKIKWMREAGKTQQDLIAEAGGDRQGLIADVYRRQGTSAQVRAAIEDDCKADEARSAQAVALMEAANRGKVPPPADGRNGNGVAGAPDAPSPGADIAGSNAAAMKKSNCQQLTGRRDEIRSRQRAGGDVHGMDALRQQDRDIGNQIRAAGC